MGMVVIKCPETGRVISTGIEMDSERFRCTAVFFSRTYCKMCAVTHDYHDFVRKEMAGRSSPPYPPNIRIANVVFSGLTEAATANLAVLGGPDHHPATIDHHDIKLG